MHVANYKLINNYFMKHLIIIVKLSISYKCMALEFQSDSHILVLYSFQIYKYGSVIIIIHSKMANLNWLEYLVTLLFNLFEYQFVSARHILHIAIYTPLAS